MLIKECGLVVTKDFNTKGVIQLLKHLYANFHSQEALIKCIGYAIRFDRKEIDSFSLKESGQGNFSDQIFFKMKREGKIISCNFIWETNSQHCVQIEGTEFEDGFANLYIGEDQSETFYNIITDIGNKAADGIDIAQEKGFEFTDDEFVSYLSPVEKTSQEFPLVGWVTVEGAFIEEVGDEINLTEIRFETQEELDWFESHDCKCAYNNTCTSKCEIYDYEEEKQ